MVNGNQRQLVSGGALQSRIGDTYGQGIGGCGWRAIEPAFQPLITLNAFLSFVPCLALTPHQLDAINAALLVDVLQIINKPAEKAGAARRIRADPITLQWEVLLFCCVCRRER